MKKHIITIATMVLSLGFALSAQAGNWKYTCKSADGTIALTRDKLVMFEKDESTKQYDLSILVNLDTNTEIDKGTTISFAGAYGEQKLGDLKITNTTTTKTIAEDDGGTCKGGHPPGFSTEAFKATGVLSLYGQTGKKIELSCVNSYYWSGTCDFDEEGQ